jgi:hypothetical protein
VLIAARNSPDCTAAEQDGELLSHLTARRDDHVVGIGEQPGEPGDLDLHTGLLSGLPDGGLLGALADVDPPSRELPHAAVGPADEKQGSVPPRHRDEHRRNDEARVRR